MKVLAFDLSLTSTGYAEPSGECGTISTGTLRGTDRLRYIRSAVLGLLDASDPTLVAIEGYAFARPNQAHQVGELGGVIRVALAELGVPWLAVPPSTVKKYATGKGTADKTAMVVAARERLGYERQQPDEADALWVRAVVHEAAGDPLVALPKVHRDAVTATGSGKKKRPSLVEQVADLLPLSDGEVKW